MGPPDLPDHLEAGLPLNSLDQVENEAEGRDLSVGERLQITTPESDKEEVRQGRQFGLLGLSGLSSGLGGLGGLGGVGGLGGLGGLNGCNGLSVGYDRLVLQAIQKAGLRLMQLSLILQSALSSSCGGLGGVGLGG